MSVGTSSIDFRTLHSKNEANQFLKLKLKKKMINEDLQLVYSFLNKNVIKNFVKNILNCSAKSSRKKNFQDGGSETTDDEKNVLLKML